jgi:hypothetical protein
LPADFEAIAAVFGPYLHFPDRCTVAPAADAVKADANVADAASDGGDLADVCGFAAPLVLAEPSHGCGGALSNAERVGGAIVAVDRGGCTFIEKARVGQGQGQGQDHVVFHAAPVFVRLAKQAAGRDNGWICPMAQNSCFQLMPPIARPWVEIPCRAASLDLDHDPHLKPRWSTPVASFRAGHGG